MISATTVPGVLRVVFLDQESGVNRSEIVCYLRPVNGRIEINYSHHQHLSRSESQGPWSAGSYHRYKLDAVTMAQVQYGVFRELWSCFGGLVRVLPGGEESMHLPTEQIPW